jgi:ferredoxin-NADP reductase
MGIYILKLLDRYEVAKNTIACVLEKPAELVFKSGQYGGFTLISPNETDAGGNTRRFSIASAPEDKHLTIVTRLQQSTFKRTLNQLPLGSNIKFAGPTGNFVLHPEAEIPAVFIAGGIGIAPFYSMIRDAAAKRSPQAIYLFYGNQSRADAAFLTELLALEQQHAPFKMIAALADADADNDWQGETGWITDKLIQKYIPDLNAPIYYICGAPAMVTALQESLAEMGINEERIKVEDFPGY